MNSIRRNRNEVSFSTAEKVAIWQTTKQKEWREEIILNSQ